MGFKSVCNLHLSRVGGRVQVSPTVGLGKKKTSHLKMFIYCLGMIRLESMGMHDLYKGQENEME